MIGITRMTVLTVVGMLLFYGRVSQADPQETASPADATTADAAATAGGEASLEAGASASTDIAPPEETTVAPLPEAEPEPEPDPVVEAEAPVEAKPLAGYDGGFFIQSSDGAFKLKIGARIKLQYNFKSNYMGEEIDREFHNSFAVPYARLYFSGHLFDKKLTYLINPGFGGGKMKLVLAFADYAFIQDILHLTFGQLKRPFSRNYLTSSGKRAFINNPLGQLGAGVDIGVQLSNNFTTVKGLEWALGIFNSANAASPTFSGGNVVVDPDTGDSTVVGGNFSNAIADFKPAMVGRIGYNNGVKGYYPTDFEGGAPRFGIAMSGHIDFDADRSDNGNAYFGFDYILKLFGFSLNGGLYTQWTQLYSGDPGYAQLGLFTQAQYLIAKKFEPVLRHGLIVPQEDGDPNTDNNRQEITVGFTVYIFNQNFKWENNFSTFLYQTPGDSLVNFQYISQLQFLFLYGCAGVEQAPQLVQFFFHLDPGRVR